MKKILKRLFLLLILIITSTLIAKNIPNKSNILNTYLNNNKNENYLLNLFDNLLDRQIFNKIINSKRYPIVNLTKYDKSPIIYIHNTHQTESYTIDNDIYKNYTVLNASYLLKNTLEELDIPVLVEDKSIKDVLNKNKWDYSYSYRVTKQYTLDTLKKYPSIKIVIDLHRDSTTKSVSTTTINGKNYAKIMFLLGKNHDNYKENETNINHLKNLLEENYPSITRSTFNKNEYTYNQEIMPTFFSIELGSDKNTITEVNNSVNALAQVLNRFLKEYEI